MLIQTQTISQSGLTPAFQAASSGGDTWQPTSTTFLYVKNGDTVQHTVTVHTTASIYGQPIGNIAVPIPAGQEVLLGPFDPGEVQPAGSSTASLTYDAVTNLTVAAVDCPAA